MITGIKMVSRKRTKNSRQRGSHTHGWGAKKKHRGAGHRGGRGAAGSGKRADQKKPSIWGAKYFGKNGFDSKSRAPEINPINIRMLDDNANSWASKGYVKFEKGVYMIDLADLGYNKLLATGRITKKYRIIVDFASAKAVEKVKSAGSIIEVKFSDKAGVQEAQAESDEQVEESDSE